MHAETEPQKPPNEVGMAPQYFSIFLTIGLVVWVYKMLVRPVVLDDSLWNLVTTMTSAGDSCTVCISREAKNH